MANPLVPKSTKFFRSPRISKYPFAKPTISGSIIKIPEPPMIIQGRQAMSSYEYRMAMALDKNNVEYNYQVSYGGGSTVSGGIILDFLAFTNVEWAIDIRGSYWHRSGDLQLRVAMNKYNNNAKLIIAYDSDCESIQTSENFLRINGVI